MNTSRKPTASTAESSRPAAGANDAHGASYPVEEDVPASRDAIIFRIKVGILQTGRGMRNLLNRDRWPIPAATSLGDVPVIAEAITAIHTSGSPAERHLLLGKIHNLRLAIRHLDGVEVPAGRTFSF